VEAESPVPFDPERPWQGLGYPEALMPLLSPEDPWPLAEACGLLHFESDLRRWSQNPMMRRERSCRAQAWEALDSHLYRRHGSGWKALTSEVQAMPAPSLPPHVLRQMPPQAAEILADLWASYQRNLLRELWEQVPEDPQQDWRLAVLRPPFTDPAPASIPPSPVEPAPDLWLAWSAPHHQESVIPVLLRSVEAPRPLDAPELQHTTGWTQTPTVTGCSLCLDCAEAEPVIRCMYHHQHGVWGDAASQ
jgi:hypothetical protein